MGVLVKSGCTMLAVALICHVMGIRILQDKQLMPC